MSDFEISLFSGIVGGVTVYYVPELIKRIINFFKPVCVYDLADDGTGKGRRRIHHSFGHVVSDDDASNKKAWLHTFERITEGHTTCFGPYTKEIPFRQKYKAVFRIKGTGFTKEKSPIIILDITHGEEKETKDGKIYHSLGHPIVEKPIYADKLKDGKYHNFDVSFDYDGQSLIEFRCAVLNPESYKDNTKQIFFDSVKVFMQ